MQKKAGVLFSLIVLFVCSFCTSSLALELPGQIDIENPGTDSPMVQELRKTGSQTVYAPVTLIHEQVDGSTTTTTIYPGLITATYQYIVYKSEITGYYTGGRVVTGSYPALTVIGDSYLNISATRVSFPTLAEVRGLQDQYSVNIAGGSFTVTYNATVRYNAQGQIVSVTPTTITRSYNYSVTGS